MTATDLVKTPESSQTSIRTAVAGVLHPHPKSRPRGWDFGRDPDAALAETVALAEAIGLDIQFAETTPLGAVRPATLLGRGKVEELRGAFAARAIEVVVIDGTLTPVQQRNLERAWGCKVIDRTGLILEIFGERARTREGRLQVELAALDYQKSRLVRSWTHLERQRGGRGFMGGPGERQIEADRRIIAERITRLKAQLKTVQRTRSLHRESRRRVPYPIVAFVGYTNAGKSTLFNRLTDAKVSTANMLFATLDPTMRTLRLPAGRQAILSDTVGFVSNLPTELVAAFSATLEEVQEADCIVHVRDVSHPDSEAQKADVLNVLDTLGVKASVLEELIEAQNKIDLLTPDERAWFENRARHVARAYPLSAATGEGTEALLAGIAKALNAAHLVHRLSIPLDDGATIAWLYRCGTVLERRDDARFAHMCVSLSDSDSKRFLSRRESGLADAAD